MILRGTSNPTQGKQGKQHNKETPSHQKKLFLVLFFFWLVFAGHDPGLIADFRQLCLCGTSQRKTLQSFVVANLVAVLLGSLGGLFVLLPCRLAS